MKSDDVFFYFDFISHNAFLAWTGIHELAARHGRHVEPVPVLFAGMLEANGQRGPAEIPAKNAWMIRDVLWKAARLGLPLAPPAAHPFNPLLALRFVSQALDDDVRTRLIDRLFRAAWCESRSLEDAAVVAALASEVGLDGAALVARASDPAVKQSLRERTDAAIRDGVFGVPSMRVDGELFWGYDDFPHLEQHLRGEHRIDAATLERWKQVRPSATRRRP
jgi:2-hydroxychromene-2-carboxylate isomerase